MDILQSLRIEVPQAPGHDTDQEGGEGHQDEHKDDHAKLQGIEEQKLPEKNRSPKEDELHPIDDDDPEGVQGLVDRLQGCHVVPAGDQEAGGSKHALGLVEVLTGDHDDPDAAALEGHFL